MIQNRGKRERGVVSYMKCGRTWVRLFLEYYLHDDEKDEFRVQFRHDDIMEYKHKVVLIRNPLDMFNSLYYHVSARLNKPVSIEELLNDEKDGIKAFNAFLKDLSESPEDFLLVKYEDMFKKETWVKIIKTLGLPYRKKSLDYAFEKTKFSNIRANIDETLKFREPGRYIDGTRGRDSNKFRKGVIGDYKNLFNKDQIQYIIDNVKFRTKFESVAKDYGFQVVK